MEDKFHQINRSLIWIARNYRRAWFYGKKISQKERNGELELKNNRLQSYDFISFIDWNIHWNYSSVRRITTKMSQET